MTKQALLGQRQYFAMIHEVTLRIIGSFKDEDLDFRPKPGMRSVRELIQHMYIMQKTMPLGIQAGELTEEIENQAIPEKPEAQVHLARIRTIADAQAFGQECYEVAESIAPTMTDADFSRPLKSPFGTFTIAQYWGFLYDEFWHHRGQLTTYARLAGRDIPMIYDYKH